MNRKKNRFAVGCIASLFVAAASLAFAQAQSDKKPPLPPGWTEADAHACAAAATPGPEHKHLTQAVGVWKGKVKMWMTPDAEPSLTECTSTITAFLDGRFTKCEMTGDFPGMGPFTGYGIYGYDNVLKEFQSSWVASCGTGITQGTGQLSSDGQTLTWAYQHSCPITKKKTPMREIERRIGKDSMTLETYSFDPKSGKEFKVMEVAFTRQPGTSAVSSTR